VSKDHSRERHIPVLDGLRGLAILAVIVCHVNLTYRSLTDSKYLGSLFDMFFSWGWSGVDLFFVLSGFLITGILYDTKGCAFYFRTFYARRTLRIMPLYFGFLLLLVGLSRVLHSSISPYVSLTDALALGSYTYNFRLVLMRHTTDLTVFWSLAVEEHFYLIWPLLVWAMGRRSLMRLCLALSATSFLLRLAVVLSGEWRLTAYLATPCRMDGLLAGSFVALAQGDRTVWGWLRRNAGRLVCGSGSLVFGLLLNRGTLNDGFVLTVGLAGLAVFFSGLIVLSLDAVEGSPLRHVLENHVLRAVGKYSYGIYIFHSLILEVGRQALTPRIHFPGVISELLALVWVTVATFAVAWLSYHFYEKRFLRLKRFFEYQEQTSWASVHTTPGMSHNHAAIGTTAAG
jgi:peptidoglycan/LPS O-acetylase OafA/YrhL